ncbi:hypothetical protein WJX72_011690 [[Myrmecia] bisecta]|uniref:Antifreeze protein n=1 Tax=[Myrmecia] bisecta TaxID=41462 RepID=A0AAW1PIH9_9CHLO
MAHLQLLQQWQRPQDTCSYPSSGYTSSHSGSDRGAHHYPIAYTSTHSCAHTGNTSTHSLWHACRHSSSHHSRHPSCHSSRDTRSYPSSGYTSTHSRAHTTTFMELVCFTNGTETRIPADMAYNLTAAVKANACQVLNLATPLAVCGSMALPAETLRAFQAGNCTANHASSCSATCHPPAHHPHSH